MALSRRQFLRGMGVGAAAGAAFQIPAHAAGLAAFLEPQRSRGSNAILLNSNENPYGPSARTMETLRDSLQHANRYPDFHYEKLTKQIAALHHVHTDQVVLGCGSTEILRIAVTGLCGPGKSMVMPAPTFEAIGYYADTVGTRVIRVPLNAKFGHDLPEMLRQTESSTNLVYVCNPNNPTASLTPRAEIDEFIAKLPDHTWVLIDEAYHHFAGEFPEYTSYLDRPAQNPRVIVARTFSKVFGMAGMRLGYAVASPETAAKLVRMAGQDNVNAPVAAAGVAALSDEAGTREAIAKNAAVRRSFIEQASTRKLPVIPCAANFAMMRTGRPVQELIDHFSRNQIMVGRPFPPMNDYLRISFGTSAEMTEFWDVWDKLPKG